MEKKALQTALVHSDYTPPEGFAAFPAAIHHASTILFKNVAALRSGDWKEKNAYTYGLHGTPTTFTLEARIAEIEGGERCLLAPSGLAAIAMIDFAVLKTGDDILLPDNIYNPNRVLGNWLQEAFNITARYYDPMIGAGIAQMIQPNTKLIWTEAPGSVSMEVPDLRAICAAAKEKGVLVALDNTWSAGLALRPFELGVDISMQALTKYQSGGSDVLMGAVITRDRELHEKIANSHMRLGLGVGADDAYLVMRGLPTMKLRFEAHDAGALKVAAWLKQRPEISRMLHPAFEDCPGHEVWKRDFTGAGGLFSVLFDARFSEEQTDRFVDSLRLFKIGYSWGGANSLCIPYRIQAMRRNWQDGGTLVRFYIGLEDPADLIADIEQALARM
ncbi:cystathionine beta-lyase [Massilia endophytica]|uniref:cystathionine beta-lyase n=1 Tax=Massilia endophytica TaxID=2899220 RepID=UPI001E428B00|nr:cystathionine beta-lyase [Massilia endophytica]UGQ48398.1 cystathionine beta-lyase [Massilia endophytica]